MDLANWILSQSISIKLILGLSTGIIIYAVFRWFIHIANKTYQEGNPKKSTRQDRLKNLFGQ